MSTAVEQFVTTPRHFQTNVTVRDFPDGLSQRFVNLLDGVMWLLPRWVMSIDIAYCATPRKNELGQSCNIEAMWRYATAHVRVMPEFFTEAWDDQRRRMTLIHELLHLSFSPLADFAHEIAASDRDHEHISEREERVVVELAAMLASKFAEDADDSEDEEAA